MAELVVIGGLAAAGAGLAAHQVAKAKHAKKMEQALHKEYDFFKSAHAMRPPATVEERRELERMQSIGRWACCLPLPCLAFLATKAGSALPISAAIKARGGPRISIQAVRLQAEEGLNAYGLEGAIHVGEIRQEISFKALRMAAQGKGVPPIVDEDDARLKRKKMQIAFRNIKISEVKFQRPITDEEGDSFRIVVTGLQFRADTDFALENLALLSALFDDSRTGRARIEARSGMLFVDGCLDPDAKKLAVRASFAPLSIAMEHSNKVVQATVNKLIDMLEPSIRAKLQQDVQRHVGRAVGRLVRFRVQDDAPAAPASPAPQAAASPRSPAR